MIPRQPPKHLRKLSRQTTISTAAWVPQSTALPPPSPDSVGGRCRRPTARSLRGRGGGCLRWTGGASRRRPSPHMAPRQSPASPSNYISTCRGLKIARIAGWPGYGPEYPEDENEPFLVFYVHIPNGSTLQPCRGQVDLWSNGHGSSTLTNSPFFWKRGQVGGKLWPCVAPVGRHSPAP